MNKGGGTKDKMMSIFQRAWTKGKNGLRDWNLLRFVRDPHYLNHVNILRQELFNNNRVEYQGCDSSVNDREINSQPWELSIQAGYEEGLEEGSVIPWSPQIRS